MSVTYETTPASGVRFHQLAELFPWIEGDALERLREDIRVNGVREPIVFMGDAIIDGRNRYMCARDLGIPYPRREFGSDPRDGSDPVAFVLSQNLHRRHLTESQRAVVAGKIANLPRGNPTFSPNSANLRNSEPAPAISTADAAKMLNVGTRSVEAARKVQAVGAPELAAAVERGEVSVSAAAAVAELPPEEQAAVVSEGPKAVQAKAKEVRQAKSAPAPVEATALPDAEAKARRELAKLTPEALIDDVLGLRADLAEVRVQLREVTRERDTLKAQIKDFSGDQAEVIRRQTREIERLKSEMFRANEKARVNIASARRAQDEAKALRAKLEAQEIRL